MEWYVLKLKILYFKLNVNIILKVSRRLSSIKYRQIRIYSKSGHFLKITSLIIEFYRISITVSFETPSLILAFITTKFPHQSLIRFSLFPLHA